MLLIVTDDIAFGKMLKYNAHRMEPVVKSWGEVCSYIEHHHRIIFDVPRVPNDILTFRSADLVGRRLMIIGDFDAVTFPYKFSFAKACFQKKPAESVKDYFKGFEQARPVRALW